ncbi:spore germination protein [Cytobacillus gottheilii]|uniref:Spore germination protein n=2 Tax=Bacillaceae TaxID=186817 RepID=A0A7V7RJF4_9BACI|nr:MULTISPECIES: spore germination protein [Bacillaceae]KAB2330920.1 spore germination protein [Bacillus mesophilum]QVY62833.1 spore germination protein [Cytobacillus gottheilii]
MPAIVGVVQVISVGSSSIFNIGDVYKMMPISTAKTFSGSGSFNTGDGLKVTNHYSTTNTYDSDGIDQANIMNL